MEVIKTTKAPVTIYVYNMVNNEFKLLKKISRNIYNGNKMSMVLYQNKWYYLHHGISEKINGKN